MEIDLERGDLLKLDAISKRGTLKLLPPGKKGKQKLLVGDDSGNLSCYEFKKGEPQQVFVTKAFDEGITAVSIGGVATKQDKIFVASGQRVVGITKKGKEFFKLTSSLTEAINHITVEDNKLWTGCEFIYNMINNGADKEFYMCQDIINSMLVRHMTSECEYDVVFGCQDNCIRCVQGSTLILEIPTLSPVTDVVVNTGFGNALLGVQSGSTSFRSKSDAFGHTYFVYGMQNGSIGMVEVSYNAPSVNVVKPLLTFTECWILEDWCKKRVSTISALEVHELTKTGFHQIIVGRGDGRIEVYEQISVTGGLNNTFSNHISPPQLIFSTEINESVRSIQCGFVNTSTFPEIVVAGYSGKIISFTTEPTRERVQDDKHGRSLQTINDEHRITHLKTEIATLKTKLEKDTLKLKKLSTTTADLVANTAIDFPINYEFILDNEQRMYVLTIELQLPIDLVLLKSPVALDLVEAEVGDENVSVFNQSQVEPTGEVGASKSKNFFASFRCQGNEKRLRLNLRSTEGESGDMEITISTARSGTAVKSAKTIKVELKPLSLHNRINSFNSIEEKRPRHVLKCTGNSLQVGMIATWIQTIFPDVPQKLISDDDVGTADHILYYRNVFTQAVAKIHFRSREVTFECESASTIAIIKENMAKLATYHRVNIDESLDLKDECITSFLSLMQIIDAIQEIITQEGSVTGDNTICAENFPWLSSEYCEIASQQEQIKSDYKLRIKSLQYLGGIITDLYVDYQKLKNGGILKKNKLPELHKIIYTADMQSISNFFLYDMV